MPHRRNPPHTPERRFSGSTPNLDALVRSYESPVTRRCRSAKHQPGLVHVRYLNPQVEGWFCRFLAVTQRVLRVHRILPRAPGRWQPRARRNLFRTLLLTEGRQADQYRPRDLQVAVRIAAWRSTVRRLRCARSPPGPSRHVQPASGTPGTQFGYRPVPWNVYGWPRRPRSGDACSPPVTASGQTR